jgi:hypothetical protein
LFPVRQFCIDVKRTIIKINLGVGLCKIQTRWDLLIF